MCFNTRVAEMVPTGVLFALVVYWLQAEGRVVTSIWVLNGNHVHNARQQVSIRLIVHRRPCNAVEGHGQRWFVAFTNGQLQPRPFVHGCLKTAVVLETCLAEKLIAVLAIDGARYGSRLGDFGHVPTG